MISPVNKFSGWFNLFLALPIFLSLCSGFKNVYAADIPQFPAIVNIVEPGLFHGSLTDIEAFLKKREELTQQIALYVRRLFLQEKDQEKAQILEQALQYFQNLSLQHLKIISELKKNPVDSLPSAPDPGKPPFAIDKFESFLAYQRQLEELSRAYSHQFMAVTDQLEAINSNLHSVVSDYTMLLSKKSTTPGIFLDLGQIFYLQADYAIEKIRKTNLEKARDKLKSLLATARKQVAAMFNRLFISQDLIVKRTKELAATEKAQQRLFLKANRRLTEITKNIIDAELELETLRKEAQAQPKTDSSKGQDIISELKRRARKTSLQFLQLQRKAVQEQIDISDTRVLKAKFEKEWIELYANDRMQDVMFSRRWKKKLAWLRAKLEYLHETVSQKQVAKTGLAQKLLELSQLRSQLKDNTAAVALLNSIVRTYKQADKTIDKLLGIMSTDITLKDSLAWRVDQITGLMFMHNSDLVKITNWIKNHYFMAKSWINSIFYFPITTVAGVPVTFASIMKVILLILISVIFLRYIQKKLAEVLAKRTRLSIGLINSITTLTYYVLLLLLFLVILSTAGLNLSQLTVVIGALGVGIGFGLQAIANNFVSGLILLTERSVKVGDIVELEGGVFGEVKNQQFPNRSKT